MPRFSRRVLCAGLLALCFASAQPCPADVVFAAAPQSPAPQAPAAVPSAAPPMPVQIPSAARPSGAARPEAVSAQAGNPDSPRFPLPDATLSWRGYFEALAILCFVLAGFIAILWLLKRVSRKGMRAGTGAPGLCIENRLALGPKKWIIAVRFMDRRLLLGVTERNITPLAEVPLEPEGAAFREQEKDSSSM